MTKRAKIEMETANAPTSPKRPRKLTKAEEEGYLQQLNKVSQPVRKAIKEGKIQAPWWRQNG